MEYEIIHLPKDKWTGTIIPIGYKTNKYYDVIVNKTNKGFSIEIEKKVSEITEIKISWAMGLIIYYNEFKQKSIGGI